MKKYLLDTNVIIDFLKGNPTAITIYKSIENSQLYISPVTISEYHFGAYRTKNSNTIVHHFQEYIKRSKIIILTFDKHVAEKYAELQFKYAEIGKPKPIFDLILAATCVVHNLTLVTFNKKDFSGIEGLQIR